MNYFDTEFGFTEREVTAMMGSHTIGRAEHFNSSSYKLKQVHLPSNLLRDNC